MVYKLIGSLSRYVFLCMFLDVQRSFVLPAPTPASCQGIHHFTDVLKFEAENLCNTYNEHLRPNNNSQFDNDVPTIAISGSSVSGRLRDIYSKNVLFQWHLSQVETYQKELLLNPKPVMKALSNVRNRLNQHLAVIKILLQHIEPEITELTTQATPQLSHDDYMKKLYGWGVVVRLTDWVGRVSQVLKELKNVCVQN